MKNTILFIALILSSISYAQDTSEEKLPYYEVPEYSKEFTAGTMAARMIDGLGFRFYWSSEGLTEKDLTYRPSEEVRSSEETIDHILDLSYIVVNSTLKKPNSRVDKSAMSYEDKRKQTLINLKTAADILRDSDDISQYKIIFGENEIPFWNQVNGPIADAIWHCGQLASFRRVTGNPINPKINHFTGKVKKTDE
ncbi:hypothetical protein [Psychroserpens luteolus]|uniref:hypothetical protein n=1 Tax=Psychroserpens luteolus TaxID=2855840 RepID=UPI001E34D4E6|nr:hypothetical protein [Psychroserpens luteolus]MCD2260883.1 hypothetical protein [Psychroserpens luteolus]